VANPDFVDEGVTDQGGSASVTAAFPAAWAANQIALWVIATDGAVPTLSTANGFVLAQDPLGHTASVTTNGGTAGTADCGIFVFWKRLVGSTTTTDPAPVLAAAASWGGTVFSAEVNTYGGCRTTGTPFHLITTAIVGTATTTVAPPAVTPTLNACTVLAMAASSNDDTAFNDWVFSGAAAPIGQIDTGWHNGTGNACAFNGGRGGYATAGGARSGTTTFATATKQAQITMVLASLAEAGGAVDDDSRAVPPMLLAVATQRSDPAHDELPGTASAAIVEDDSVPAPQAARWIALAGLVSGDADAVPVSVVDEDAVAAAAAAMPARPPLLVSTRTDDESPTASAGALVDEDPPVPAALSQARPPVPLVAVSDDAMPTPSAVTIGGAADAQRSFNAAPQTGTLTTPAPVPAWAQSHAYVVDPTAGGINRVLNGGTLYQCSSPGTSASSGAGPSATTIGSTQADGGVTWYVVGPAQGTNTIAGSQIIATVMRGNQSLAGSVDPTDNDSGTYTAISNTSYGGAFPTAFAGVWRRTTVANTKTGFTLSAVWGGSGGAGDELSLAWVELQGVVVGAPHASSEVDRTASSGGTVTAGAITTTKRCLIVSYWFGIGTVQSDGAPDAATPAGGLTLIAGSTGPLSLTVNGYIQHMAAWRIANPGTFSEVWTASPTDQGAKLVTVAFEDPTVQAIGVDEDSPRVWVLQWAPQPAPFVARSDDDIPLAVAVAGEEDATAAWSSSGARLPLVGVLSTDDLPALAVVEDDAQPAAAQPAVSRWSSVAIADDDLPVVVAASIIEDDAAAVWTSGRLGAQAPDRASDDDVVPSVIDEDSPSAWQPTAAPASPVAARSDDDMLIMVVGEDAADPSMPRSASAPAAPASAASEDTLPAAALWEGDSAMPWPSTVRPPPQPVAPDDDSAILTAPAPPPPIVDDESVQSYVAPWRLYSWPRSASSGDDFVPGAAIQVQPAAFYGVRVVSRYVAVVATGVVVTVPVGGL
jgi:hypothetical protein